MLAGLAGVLQRRHWFGFPLVSSSSQPLIALELKGGENHSLPSNVALPLAEDRGTSAPAAQELSSAGQVLFKATAVIGPRAEDGSGPSTALGAGSLTVNRCHPGPLNHGAANKTMSL